MPIATVLTANSLTTEVRLACPTSTSASSTAKYCDREGFGEVITIISGTRYEAVGTLLDPADPSESTFYRSWGCDYTAGAKTQVVTLVQRGGNSDTNGTLTAELKSYYYGFSTASIVEGASLLSGGGTATTAAPSITDGASSSSPRTTDSGSATQTTPEATGSAPASASTAAAARFPVGQSALFALAGAAWSMW
jgi:hypothetical protein